MEKERTFRRWVYEYSDALYRYALRHIREEELSKDLVQDTFLAAWRNFEGYKGEASVRNWLFVILKNKITDHYRNSHTRMEIEATLQEKTREEFFDKDDHWIEGAYPKSWSVDFTNQVEAKDFQNVFRSCGKKLKQLQHAVFVLKYVDDMSSEQICKELQITPANYWVLLHRAKVQLRACLEKNWI